MNAFFDLPWWGYVLVALVFTHLTIASVTIYLHRCQAHKALTLHPFVSHFFRLWLWLSTAMVTKEWVAVHRKHHARVETADDPHSPQVLGIHKVLWLGAWLYHKEAHRQQTLDQYGMGTPDDWLERHIFSRNTYLGPVLMYLINTALFGLVPGSLIWVTQMLWIPFWAAGVINGIGHFWGYRSFDVKDASRNIIPWGFVIGGEELHNNHHAFAGSARFSVQPWEFDLGWLYIRVLQRLGMAKVRKSVPVLVQRPALAQCDMDTVQAILGNRFQVMSVFVKDVMRTICHEDARRVRPLDRRQGNLLWRAWRLVKYENVGLSSKSRQRLSQALALSPRLKTAYQMKQRLQALWARSAESANDSLLAALEEWCHAAETSGIDALRDFAFRLRGFQLQNA